MYRRLSLRLLCLLLTLALPASAQFTRDNAANKKIDEAINEHYLATDFDKAAVEKNLLANDRAGLKLLGEFKERLAALPAFTPEAIHAALESFAKDKGFVNEKGVNVGPVAQPVRVAIAGVPVTPPLGEALSVLGKDSVMKRLHAPFVALLAAACLLAGCGQKGPLYLPDDEKAAKEHQKDVYIR